MMQYRIRWPNSGAIRSSQGTQSLRRSGEQILLPSSSQVFLRTTANILDRGVEAGFRHGSLQVNVVLVHPGVQVRWRRLSVWLSLTEMFGPGERHSAKRCMRFCNNLVDKSVVTIQTAGAGLHLPHPPANRILLPLVPNKSSSPRNIPDHSHVMGSIRRLHLFQCNPFLQHQHIFTRCTHLETTAVRDMHPLDFFPLPLARMHV